MPLLLIQNGSKASASQADGTPTSPHDRSRPSGGGVPPWELARDTTAGSTPGATSPTTAPPTTAPPITAPASAATAAPTQAVVQHSLSTTTTTRVVPPTTTTTTTTPAPVASPFPGSVHYGQVTWYAHPAGSCASPYLPFGTVVRVTNPANGASVSCVVDDREADTYRSIDLATDTFAAIAPLSQGVIDAQLSW